MLYFWVYFENSVKDFYLPDVKNWTGALCLHQAETGWDFDVTMEIRVLDGVWYLTPAQYFCWQDINCQNAEKVVKEGDRLVMSDGIRSIGIVVSSYQKENTIFSKFLFPAGTNITLGRSEKCTIWFDNELVSSLHAEFMRGSTSSSCIYQDQSKNGSYINGQRIAKGRQLLKFGDIITIATGLKIVYLGELLAINRPDTLKKVDMQPYTIQASSRNLETVTIPSAIIDYHRAPRLLECPEITNIEIEPPIPKQNKDEMPMFLQIGPSLTMMVPMMAGALVGSLTGTRSMMASGIAMMGASSLLAVAWGLVNRHYRTKQTAFNEKKRKDIYRTYIKEMESQLRMVKNTEQQRLATTCLSVKQCAALPGDGTFRLWERMPSHYDFLDVRMGLGNADLPSCIKIETTRLSMIDDPLRDEAKRLKDTYGVMENVPLTISLRDHSLIGILGDEAAEALAQSIVIQTAALHSYTDVKICVLYDENHQSRWGWTRWLPHVFPSSDRSLRMSVYKPGAIHEVLSYIDEILRMRIETAAEQKDENDQSKDTYKLPHYVIVCTQPELVNSHPIMHRLLKDGYGMTLVSVVPSMEKLPKECKLIVNTLPNEAGLFTAEGNVRRLNYEYPGKNDAISFARRIAPIRSRDLEENTAIPSMVTFLRAYGVHRQEELDIWRFWNENMAYEGLRSIIGLKAGSQPFVLDISDRFHGPHGLIAGTTGSGKSVMLQTYILSLALNYHPNQVQFILIDYKGGGMADAFKTLPHVAGLIDNLQGERTIMRALASIQGEIRRRESVFKQAGVSSIDEYIRLSHDDPDEEAIPHTIIVVDEFAELKKEKPDFMRELISASRVGRSVGIHLILATQKPSNSVDNEIWSNTRFRICLRVASRGDSMDMLKRPDAAYIKGMGRCFVQVGSDELFEEVQTCYSGAEYRPDEIDPEELPRMLGDTGAPIAIRAPKRAPSQRKKTEMDASLEHIIRVAQAHGVKTARRLWKEEIAPLLFLKDIEDFRTCCFQENCWPTHDTHEIKAVIGMADDVAHQQHLPVVVDFTRNRNHLFVGMALSGKTTLLQTLAASLAMRYDPARLQMYIFSLSSRTLGSLSSLPHVGEIVYEDEPYEQLRLLSILEKENESRKEQFAKASTDSYLEYCRSCDIRKDLVPVPAIVVFIDRMAQAQDLLDDDAKIRLHALIREGSGRGIFFVATAMTLNETPLKLQPSFYNMALEMPNRSDYAEVLGRRVPMEMGEIKRTKGRGMVRMNEELMEIQVALYGDSDIDAERANHIHKRGTQMRMAWKGVLPRPIPRIPQAASWDTLLTDSLRTEEGKDVLNLPLGYLLLEGSPCFARLDSAYAWLIAGPKGSGQAKYLMGIAGTMRKREADVYMIGGTWMRDFALHIGCTYLSAIDEALIKAIDEIQNAVAQRNKQLRQVAGYPEAKRLALVRTFRPIALIIDDLGSTLSTMPSAVSRFLEQAVTGAARFGVYLFASVSYQSMPHVRATPMVRALVDRQCGLVLGGKMADCDFFQTNMPYSQRAKLLPPGVAYRIEAGKTDLIQIPKS